MIPGSKVMVLSHCYPHTEDRLSGIWLHRVFAGNPYIHIKKSIRGAVLALWRLLKTKQLVIACFLFPAGVIAWLSRKRYILVGVGLDCILVGRHRWLGLLLYPVVRRARAIVFISEHNRRQFENCYGQRFTAKSRVILLPVEELTVGSY
jgi:hypothetical protein